MIIDLKSSTLRVHTVSFPGVVFDLLYFWQQSYYVIWNSTSPVKVIKGLSLAAGEKYISESNNHLHDRASFYEVFAQIPFSDN